MLEFLGIGTPSSYRGDMRSATWCPVTSQRRIATRSWITEHLRWCGAKNVAEIGVRDGYGAATIAGVGMDCTGYDNSADRLKAAHTNFSGPNLRWRHVDLPYTRAVQHSADAVVFDEILEEWEDPRPLLREALRILRPGGTVVVVTPNRLTTEGFHTRPRELSHAWEYTPSELKNLLSKRFEQVQVHGLHTGRIHRAISRVAGEKAQHLLERVPVVDRAPWLRAFTSLVKPGEFDVNPQTKDSAMLIAVAQTAAADVEINASDPSVKTGEFKPV